MTRGVPLSAGLAAAGFTLVACAGGTAPRAAGGSSTSPTTGSAAPSPSPLASASPSSSSPTPTSPTDAGDCRFTQLRVSHGPVVGATGHSAVLLLFRNVSDRTCHLYGYPGVAGIDTTGRQVTQARRSREGFMGGVGWSGRRRPIPLVPLAPGRFASAIVEGDDNSPSGGACRRLAGMLVTPPDSYHSIRFPVVPGDCDGLQIHPVVPGRSGDDPPRR